MVPSPRTIAWLNRVLNSGWSVVGGVHLCRSDLQEGFVWWRLRARSDTQNIQDNGHAHRRGMAGCLLVTWLLTDIVVVVWEDGPQESSEIPGASARRSRHRPPLQIIKLWPNPENLSDTSIEAWVLQRHVAAKKALSVCIITSFIIKVHCNIKIFSRKWIANSSMRTIPSRLTSVTFLPI